MNPVCMHTRCMFFHNIKVYICIFVHEGLRMAHVRWNVLSIIQTQVWECIVF
jgi:hypothetical protein